VETISIDALKLEALRASLRGAAYVPGDEGYDGARAAWPGFRAEAERACAAMAAAGETGGAA